MEREEAIGKALEISTENNIIFPSSKVKWTNFFALVDILQQCKSHEDYNLLHDLIKQLNENVVDNAGYFDLLCRMVQEIKENETGGENTALCVMRTKNDPDADGSQSVVNDLKVPLSLMGDFIVTYSAVCFEDIEGLYHKKGYKHFVVVDDFIGSGKTVEARYQYFLNRHLSDATIGFYFVAGMAEGLLFCKERNIPVHCCKVMGKGISDYYNDEMLNVRTKSMHYLESFLGEWCGSAKLEDQGDRGQVPVPSFISSKLHKMPLFQQKRGQAV